MKHHNNRSSQRNVLTRKTTRPAAGFTAAAAALLAGAPAGYAQSSVEEAPSGGGFGSLMNFLGSKGQEAPAPEQAAGEFRTDGVYYDENATIELHVQDEDLTAVLQMLSIESERNIVASNDVSARVTANLYGVTFHEALDAILHVNGYGYIERGNFIYVYPIDVLEQIEQATRQRTSAVIRLNFLNAVDAADFVAPLLSEEGEIKSNGKVGAWTDPTSPTGNEEFANESTLVVYDYEENIAAIADLLEELDTRPAQILVEATIVQTTLNEENAFGVDFSIIADLEFADFVNPLSGVDSLLSGGSSSNPVPDDGEGRAITSNPGNTAGPATFKAGIVDNDVAVFLRVLDQVTDTSIISNPKVVTLNRQPGRVLVGRKVGYLQTTATETSTTQTVEFLDTGTQLNFRPFVTSEGLIRMELKPQVSEAALRSATDASGIAITIPDEITNELSANVLVPDGHTIVLGGLFREATTASRRQVPVIGDIPILGAAFRGHEDDIQRQEIIFLITPSIVSDQVLVDAGIRGEEAVRRVRAGAREGTLPFSRTRRAAQHLVEAEQLAAAGNTEKALYKVRQALALNPSHAEAIKLREQLVNERNVWPTDSLLDEIIERDALEHNILQHGWWGARDRAAAAPAEPQHVAQAESAPVAPARRAAKAEPRQQVQEHNFSTTVVTELDTYQATATPAETPASGEEWWHSAEFDAFMMTWEAALAQEQGRAIPDLEPWWHTSDFASFIEGFEAAAKAEGPAPRSAPVQTSDASADVATDELADFTPANAQGSTEFTTTEDGRVLLSEDNPYLYYPSADDVPEDFSQNSLAGTNAGTADPAGDVDDYLDYLQETETIPSYTEVPDDQQD